MAERILALDVGDRRIGLAITDPLGLTAQPLFTLHRTTLRADLKAIARFIRQHNVTTLVVGNPLHADGTPGAQAAKAQAFAKALEAEHPGADASSARRTPDHPRSARAAGSCRAISALSRARIAPRPQVR